MDTQDLVQASYVAASNAVVGFLQPQSYTRRFKIIAINGPAASTLRIYRGYGIGVAPINSVFPADVRTYDAASDGAVVYAGEAATFAWTGGDTGVGQRATATLHSEVTEA